MDAGILGGDGAICEGDVIVCRVNGTTDFYVVGTVVSGEVGEFSLRGVSTTIGRDVALVRAYHDRLDVQRVCCSTARRPDTSRRRPLWRNGRRFRSPWRFLALMLVPEGTMRGIDRLRDRTRLHGGVLGRSGTDLFAGQQVG